MTFPSASPPAPRPRFPRWLIVLLALGSLGALAFCAVLVIGVLTILGSKVIPTVINATESTGRQIYDPHANASDAVAQALAQAIVVDKQDSYTAVQVTYMACSSSGFA